MKSINNIIKEEIHKYIINESLSRNLYHFTNIFNLMNIIHNNSFKLSFAQKDNGERGQNSKYQYYMCFTRQRDGRVGFADGHNVRIEIDGNLLNQLYKGKPVNFFGSNGGKNRYMSNLEKYDDYYIYHNDMDDDIKFQHYTESEDRLFSNNPMIPNAKKYIKRIDILIENETFNPIYDWLLVKSDFRNIIHIYDNKNDFNLINGKDANQKFRNPSNASMFNSIKYGFIKNDAKLLEDLSVIFCYLIFRNNIDINNCGEYIKQLILKYRIKNIELDKIISGTIQYYDDLRNETKNDYGFQYRIFEELEYAASDIGNCKDIETAKKIAKMIKNEE